MSFFVLLKYVVASDLPCSGCAHWRRKGKLCLPHRNAGDVLGMEDPKALLKMIWLFFLSV